MVHVHLDCNVLCWIMLCLWRQIDCLANRSLAEKKYIVCIHGKRIWLFYECLNTGWQSLTHQTLHNYLKPKIYYGPVKILQVMNKCDKHNFTQSSMTYVQDKQKRGDLPSQMCHPVGLPWFEWTGDLKQSRSDNYHNPFQ